MTNGKPSKDTWDRFRTLWEADPTMTQGDVAKMAGVSQQAIQKRIKRDGWKKVSDQSELARRAYDKADEAALKKPVPAVPDVGGEQPHPEAAAAPASVSGVLAATAVELRAKIIDRHRKEWDGARNHIYKAIQNADFEEAKLGKISAESLKIVQDGERKAWGLDKDESDKSVTVVVKREER